MVVGGWFNVFVSLLRGIRGLLSAALRQKNAKSAAYGFQSYNSAAVASPR